MFRRLLSGLAVLGTAVATAAIMSSSSDKQESNISLKEEKTNSKEEESDSENDVAEGTEANSSKLFGRVEIIFSIRGSMKCGRYFLCYSPVVCASFMLSLN